MVKLRVKVVEVVKIEMVERVGSGGGGEMEMMKVEVKIEVEMVVKLRW